MSDDQPELVFTTVPNVHSQEVRERMAEDERREADREVELAFAQLMEELAAAQRDYRLTRDLTAFCRQAVILGRIGEQAIEGNPHAIRFMRTREAEHTTTDQQGKRVR